MKGQIIEGLMITMIVLMLVMLLSGFLIGPFYEAKVYNKAMGTNYSGWEFLFAGTTIKSFVGQGEQKTFNVKGLQ